MFYPTCQQLPWCPAHGHTGHVASPTKKPIVIVAVDVKKIQTTKKTRGVVSISVFSLMIEASTPLIHLLGAPSQYLRVSSGVWRELFLPMTVYNYLQIFLRGF